MTMTITASIALGALVVAIPAAVAIRWWMERASWYASAYHDECASHDATLRRAAQREEEAARYIDALCGAVMAAVDEAPEPERQPVRVGDSVLSRFNWN